MTYILTAQLHDEATGGLAFVRYQAYLAEVQALMPPGALALAKSDWYFDSSDHRCPHDGWLDAVTLSEALNVESGRRTIGLSVRLLGAYHDGYLTLRYADVSRYRLDYHPTVRDLTFGHRDWRYDEFRATPDARLEHEIEWWGIKATGSWLIEAKDVEAEWTPGAPAGMTRHSAG